jgi:hypothetical protein
MMKKVVKQKDYNHHVEKQMVEHMKVSQQVSCVEIDQQQVQ